MCRTRGPWSRLCGCGCSRRGSWRASRRGDGESAGGSALRVPDGTSIVSVDCHPASSENAGTIEAAADITRAYRFSASSKARHREFPIDPAAVGHECLRSKYLGLSLGSKRKGKHGPPFVFLRPNYLIWVNNKPLSTWDRACPRRPLSTSPPSSTWAPPHSPRRPSTSRASCTSRCASIFRRSSTSCTRAPDR